MVLVALPLALLPVVLPSGWVAPPASSPVGWVLLALLVMVGAPFFALATLSPTLQRWLAETDHPGSANPYFLYSASNAGSFLALLAYPLVLEPLLDVQTQARLWTWLYALLLLLVVGSAWLTQPMMRRFEAGPSPKAETSVKTSGRRRSFWVYASFVPSFLMLGVMRHISTDVASVPLLWVAPLALYLLTFVVAFQGEPAAKVRMASRALRILVIPVVISLGRLQSAA